MKWPTGLALERHPLGHRRSPSPWASAFGLYPAMKAARLEPATALHAAG